MRQNVEARADAIRLSILDLEAQRGPALLHGAVERRDVPEDDVFVGFACGHAATYFN